MADAAWTCTECGRTALPLFRAVDGVVSCYACRCVMRHPTVGVGKDYVAPEKLASNWSIAGVGGKSWTEVLDFYQKTGTMIHVREP